MKSLNKIINNGRRKWGKKNGVLGPWFFDWVFMDVRKKDRLERKDKRDKQNKFNH